MDFVNIGSRREVCWDEMLIDRSEGIRVQMHHPEFRNIAMICDQNWEGNDSGYFNLTHDNGRLRLYYNGRRNEYDELGQPLHTHDFHICHAESKDGITFERTTVHEVPFWGSLQNNIIPIEPDAVKRGSVFCFKDSNPNCPPDERYKVLAEMPNQTLAYYKSEDGIHYEKVRILADDGAYDSLNIAFWDKQAQRYFLFYRGVHGEGSTNGKWSKSLTKEQIRHNPLVRDIRVRTSEDFIHWDTPQQIQFVPERDDVDLYINNVQKYYRADHMFIGLPIRYQDRYQESWNYPHLPAWDFRRNHIRHYGRNGTVLTDSLIMTSRDGVHFRRTEEAFLTPGPERGTNWFYGNCYFCYGMAETKSLLPGAPNEISLYVSMEGRVDSLEKKLFRYALRLDGFFSWRSDYAGGKLVTKPLIFNGTELSVNFATSCAGHLRIRMLDENGTPIDGYDSGNLFGDSVDRPIEFSRPVADLAGKPVRMEISLKDADLYSFRFKDEFNLTMEG